MIRATVSDTVTKQQHWGTVHSEINKYVFDDNVKMAAQRMKSTRCSMFDLSRNVFSSCH